MEYDLELGKLVERINKEDHKLVCVQLPDGLKPKAEEIQEYVEKNTSAKITFWSGSCFGSCDIPLELKNLDVDLLVHFGHSEM